MRNRQATPALAILQRRHAEPRIDALVHAARRTESCVVDRSGHAARGFEARLEPAHALGFLEFLWREPDDCFETTLEMEWAHADSVGNALERQRLIGIARDQLAGFADARFDGVRRARVGLAAQARAQASLFGVGGRCIEIHVAAKRSTRNAGWPAIDAGRRDAVDERAVLGSVACLHGGPAGFGIEFHGSLRSGWTQ